MLKKLWRDEGGAILTTELILIIVLTVIGLIVGLTALRDAVDMQLADLAGAIAAIDVGYQWDGLAYSSSGFGTAISGSGTANAEVAGSAYYASFATTGSNAYDLISVLTSSATAKYTGMSGP